MEKNKHEFITKTYGENYNNHLLDQYKLYVDMADKISQRRQLANTFYLALNTFLLTVMSYMNGSTANFSLLCYVIYLSGILICYSWYRLILSYKKINSAKFKVIQDMEFFLPYKPYTNEWLLLEEGKNIATYVPFTHIENKIPLIFLIIYLGLMILNLVTFTLTSFPIKIIIFN